jgi:hypothetical protein
LAYAGGGEAQVSALMMDTSTKGLGEMLTPSDLEPVSGIEPLTCRLQEARPPALCALAAQMARVIALTAPTALRLSGTTFHETFHAVSGRCSIS